MLSELRIVHLAVIDSVTVCFRPGLNALTGETGSGKSLLVEAVDLVLGARGSADRVRKGAKEAEITARFEVEPSVFARWGVEAPELEDGALVLRRTLGADGRSRAWVNDRPSTLGRLRELGSALADLHGQHEQQNLLAEESHLDYLDAVGEADEAAARTALAHARAAAARRARDEFLSSLERDSREREFLRFQWEELCAAELREGEEEELAAERHLAVHAERLAQASDGALQALLEGDPGAVELLGRASRSLGQAAAVDSSLEPALRQIDEALVIAEETARDLRDYRDRLGADPQRLDAIESRLELLAGLKRKHRGAVADLIRLREEFAGTLARIEDASGTLAELERAVEAADLALRGAAAELSARRSRTAAGFSRSVTRELQGLGMTGARFRVELRPARTGLTLPGHEHPVGARGAEEAAFVLAANPGETEGPLARLASGGEISRVMLALKNVLRRVDPVPVVVFDEVDAGIGGLVAESVGSRLAAVAQSRQVLVVTHLAVIAARAGHHLRVEKLSRGGRTEIAVEALEGTAREKELARMLAGSAGGEAARKTARAILGEGGR